MRYTITQHLSAIMMTVSAASLLSACNSGTSAEALTFANPDVGNETSIVRAPTPSPTPTVSSSPIPTGSDLYNGPADVEKYVLKFIDDAKAQGVDVLSDMTNPKLTIRHASLDSYGAGVIGLCETGGGQRRVTFDPDFWNSVSETQRELLAHHEFGHCVLYRGHRTSTLSGGAVASIMYPIIMSSSTYTSNYDYYQQELFTQAASEVDPTMTVQHICDLSDLPKAE